MILTVPDSYEALLREDGLPLNEAAQVRLAAHFYSVGKVSAGAAARLAGMKRGEFEAWLRREGISMPWTEKELAHELECVNRHVPGE